MTDPIRLLLNVRTVSPNRGTVGSIGGRMADARRRRQHHAAAWMMLSAALGRRGIRTPADLAPWRATLTRLSSGTLDSDNLAMSCKALRDGIAKALGIDDGDVARLEFRYAQRRARRGEYGVEIYLEPRARRSIDPEYIQ